MTRSSHTTMGDAEPKKRRRAAKACDFCHGRGIKCAPSGTPNECKSCSDFAVACTYNRPSKRRGPNVNASSRQGQQGNGGVASSSSSSSSFLSVDGPWRAPHVAHISTIQSLAEIYAQIVYPM